MERPVWIVSAEVRPRPDSDAPEGLAGAFVDCFVPCDTPEQALARARAALDDDGYDVVDIDRCIRYDPEDWDDDNDEDAVVRTTAAEAAEGGEVLFGPFFGWPADEDGAG
jgi:hypothetical protein